MGETRDTEPLWHLIGPWILPALYGTLACMRVSEVPDDADIEPSSVWTKVWARS